MVKHGMGFVTCAVCGNISFPFPQVWDLLDDLEIGNFAATLAQSLI